MEVNLNDKLQARIKALVTQRNQIDARLQEEVNCILDAMEIEAEGKELTLSQDLTKIIINE